MKNHTYRTAKSPEFLLIDYEPTTKEPTVQGFMRSSRRPSRTGALKALSQLGPILYAIATPTGLIKIGHTSDLGKRLRKFKDFGAGDAQVLAFAFGSPEDERALHHNLRDALAAGREWYTPTADVLHVINAWRARLQREPLTLDDIC